MGTWSQARPRIACVRFTSSVAEGLWETMMEALGAHSPLVEEVHALEDSVVCVYLDARGVVPRYASEEAWCQTLRAEAEQSARVSAQVGLASGKFVALVAAQTAPAEPGYQIVAQADRLYLAPMPVEGLPLSAEVQRRLRLLGIRTMGQFAALPQNAVAEQFGPESLTAYAWAKGVDERPVNGRRCQVLEAQREFEIAEVRREALIACAAQLCERALDERPLARQAWAIRRVELQASTLDGKTLRRSAWLGDTPGTRTLRVLLTHLVDSLRGESLGISALGVRLVSFEPAQGRQLNLLTHNEASLRLEQTLRQLSTKHSPACVLRAERLEQGLPLLAERYALRACYP